MEQSVLHHFRPGPRMLPERPVSRRIKRKPGRDQNIPGGTEPGTPELSKNDMKAVEEALQAKGYKVGKVDGIADNDTRQAIRAFQKDSGFSMTGMVDQKTADQLGVKISSKSGGRSSSGASASEPMKKKAGDDQSLPPAGRN